MKRILFLYFTGFSRTGGIEKFNRCFLKALQEVSTDNNFDIAAISSHDKISDERYFPQNKFKGFSGNKIGFVLQSVFAALQFDTIIIGHIHLALLGCIIKFIKPSVRLIVITHGIEVYQPLDGIKKKLLQIADQIFSVSNFTKEQLLVFNMGLDANKIKLFPNTIDPYFIIPNDFEKPEYLLKRYGLNNSFIALTISRLSSSEQYKGYDNVIEIWNEVLKMKTNAQYLIFGKADIIEKKRVEDLIEKHSIKASVHLLGYINDDELTDHYLLGDVFVLPSKREGFGIVFIEAMACGRKVIAGNRDGSVDALLNGELGVLVNPEDSKALTSAILSDSENNFDPYELQQKVIAVFGFPQFKQRLKNYLV